MKIIGITGASGSGKSTFVKMLNLKVIDADKVAREVVKKGGKCLEELVKVFGEDILLENGELDRKALAKKAFSSNEKTLLLNKTTHPFIDEKIKKEIEKLYFEKEKAIVIDAPQLFEAGCDKFCDVTIGVIADEEIRLNRIIKRDKLTLSQAKTRLNAGKDNKYFIEKCDKIIINNDETDKLKSEAQSLLELIGLK